ncbi:MAG: hypothetical protein JO342_14990 [Solirubrobacterales bacterium]|nr:hypothetical protein [Solirubrobacterales bacterium]
MLRRPFLTIAVALVSVVALAAAGCGVGTQHTSTAGKHAKRPVVLRQASLAVGAYHRFIWIPARAGKLFGPVSPAVSQGAAAAQFAYRELKLAARNAEHNKRLWSLFAAMEVTADKLKALGAALSDHPSLAEIESVNGVLNRIAATAKQDGHRIIDATPAQIAAAGGPRA